MTNRPQEQRFYEGEVEYRTQGSEPVVEGYAAVFNKYTKPFGTFKEAVMEGAFTRTLNSGKDIVVLLSHQPHAFLGRTATGTAKVAEDSNGLHYQVRLPNTQAGRDVAELIERGDIRGSSFGFGKPTGNQAKWSMVNGERVRQLHELSLVDVGPTPYPAYEDSTAQVRTALEGLAEEVEAFDVDMLIAAHQRDPEEFRSLIRGEKTPSIDISDNLDVDVLIAQRRRGH